VSEASFFFYFFKILKSLPGNTLLKPDLLTSQKPEMLRLPAVFHSLFITLILLFLPSLKNLRFHLMSITQQIRDKYARWAVIAIAVSLLGFILMDAFAGRTSIFGGNSTTVGKINGKKIDYRDFAQKVKAQEESYQAQGYAMNDQTRQQVQEGVWNQEITEVVMGEQYNELGLAVGKKEMGDILYGANPPQDIKQAFTDPKTGQFNGFEAQKAINQMMKDPERKAQMTSFMEGQEQQRLMAKYTSLLSNSVYYPKWYVQKQIADNSLAGNISFVNVPYTTISDSAVKVSDADVQDFINKHKKDFEQKEETRGFEYVTFSAAPSAADTAAVRNTLLNLRDSFERTTDNEAFLRTNGSAFQFFNSYVSKDKMQQPNKDSILSAGVGRVYGPYVDANSNGAPSVMVLSKIVDSKQWPDTVKVRHVLVATVQQNPQTGQSVQVRSDEDAKKLIDSIQGLNNKGVSFDTLVAKFSEDPGSKDKGGVYDNITTGQMVPEFNDFIFGHKTGEKGIVKTSYGYHYIEILSQKGSTPAYKIAYLAKPIVASDETDNNAQNAANMFAGNSRDLKAFNDNYTKDLKPKGLNKLSVPDVRATESNIPGLGSSREFVRAIFNTDKGDVLEKPIRVGDAYVVAVVTDVNKPGLGSVAKVRPMVEGLLRNQKKAEQIKQKIGTVTTLEDAVTKTGQQIQNVDSVRFNNDRKIAFESKVIGATFNPANNGKVVNEAIAGTNGVYVLRVNSTYTVPVEMANPDDVRQSLEAKARQMSTYSSPVEALKKKAKITDNRAKFF
jgi:peptidyl-prolyl cis-trans isomerase D